MQSIPLIVDVDKQFAKIAQNSIVTGTTLPSGFKIPSEGIWYIQNESVIQRLRIAFAGPMASGKSTMAKIISQKYDCDIHSFANPVKEIAKHTFGMIKKDRNLLQIIGMTGRAIDPNTWTNKLVQNISNCHHVCVDDLRFANECRILKENGFIIIYLDIPKDIRIQRIKKIYKDQADKHISAMGHVSEQEPCKQYADYILNEKETNAILSSGGQCLKAIIESKNN